MTTTTPHTLDYAKPTRRTDDRLVPLDGLRAFAIGGVLYHHWVEEIERFRTGFDFGTAGVYLFFVLSGYLITSILLRARDDADAVGQPALKTLGHFYVRRFLRIFPAYYLTIAVAALLIPDTRAWLISNLLYLSNFSQYQAQQWSGVTTPFWTLAVEEQFYLVWPWLMLFLPRRLLLPVIVASIVIAPLFRVGFTLLNPDLGYFRLFPWACTDALGLGGLLAYLRSRDHDVRWLIRLGLIVGFLMWVPIRTLIILKLCPSAVRTLELTAMSLFFVGIVGWVSGDLGPTARRFLSLAPLVYLGTLAYGLYLWHTPVHYLFDRFLMPRIAPHIPYATPAGLVFSFFAVLLVATMSWYGFEKPINSLKRYWPYVRRSR